MKSITDKPSRGVAGRPLTAFRFILVFGIVSAH
jgi:hypothetical protein